MYIQTKYMPYLLQRPRPIVCLHVPYMRRFTPIGGQDLNKPIPYNAKDAVKDQIAASLRVSLRNLRTCYIDSYLLHSPLKTVQATLEAWRALMAAQDAGSVRKIGVSNVYDVRILAALGELRKVQVVQNRWYEGNMWDPDVWKYCKNHGIEYQLVPLALRQCHRLMIAADLSGRFPDQRVCSPIQRSRPLLAEWT